MQANRLIRAVIVLVAGGLALFAVSHPPTAGKTVEPNEWFGRVSVTMVARASRPQFSEGLNSFQLLAELAFIAAAAALGLVKTRERDRGGAAIQACALASNTATVAMLCLPFGYGVAARQFGLEAYFTMVWSSPLLWANPAAIWVACRTNRGDRQKPGRIIVGLLWLAVSVWLVGLVVAPLLEDFSSTMNWLVMRQVNSGCIATFLAVLFAALAGSFHNAKSTSAPPASGPGS